MDRNTGFANFDDDTGSSQNIAAGSVETKNHMPFLMDKILQEVADQAYEAARLRRDGVDRP